MATFEDAIDTILLHEGGYVDHPNDPGGATNFGVSLRALRQLKDYSFDIDKDGQFTSIDIKGLTVEQAKEFYLKHYWTPWMSDIQTQVIATKLLDMAVNMGPVQAARIVQRALNLLIPTKVDGIIGRKTIDNINSVDSATLLGLIQLFQVKFYHNLVKENKKFAVFLHGWLNRALYEA